MEGRIWLINHNGSADLHTPIHPPRHTSLPISCVLNKMKILSYLAFLSFFVGNLSDTRFRFIERTSIFYYYWGNNKRPFH